MVTKLGTAISSLFSLAVLLTFKLSGGTSVSPTEPGFVGTLKNVTVPEGRDVTLSCTVKNLDGHKVAWIHYDKSAILTVQTSVITRNPRISVSHEAHRTWNLHIREVQRADEGAYMCQINTAKAKTRLSYLNVVVPPRIEDNLSSGDKVRTEGSNVTLECYASGSPTPTVTWKREDGQPISIDKINNFSSPVIEGPILRLYKISRLDMGAYMCIAANGIPPAVSKRIQLGIDFPPMMWVPAQQMSVMAGSEIKLICYVEAHPEALTFWEHNGRMLQPSPRITIRNHLGSPRYKVGMELSITRVHPDDFGNYKCIAKNPRGQTDGDITLTVDIPSTTTPLETSPSTVVEIVPQISDKYQAHANNGDSYSSSLNDYDNDQFSDKKEDKNFEKERRKKNRNRTTTSRYDSESFFGSSTSSATASIFVRSHVEILLILFLYYFSNLL